MGGWGVAGDSLSTIKDYKRRRYGFILAVVLEGIQACVLG